MTDTGPATHLGYVDTWGYSPYAPVSWWDNPFGNSGYDYGSDQQQKPSSILNDVYLMDPSSTQSLLDSLSAAAGSAITPQLLAAFSAYIYRFGQPGANEIPSGWTRLSNPGLESSSTGFFGMALRQDATGAVIFVVRGSQEVVDFYDDADLFDVGLLGSNASDFAHQDSFEVLIDDAMQWVSSGTDIHFAGHSLGGALAAGGLAYLAQTRGEYTYNLAGTTFGTLPIGNVLHQRGYEAGFAAADRHITNYMRDSDPVEMSHAFGQAPGNLVVLPTPASDTFNSFAENHSILRYVNETSNNPWEIDIGRDNIPYADPIFIDLDGDGVSIIGHAQSNMRFDFDGDRIADRTPWVDSGDGVLFLDIGRDGLLTRREEIAFSTLTNARSDLQALSHLDANDDGEFSALDPAFNAFMIWRDANGDGVFSANEAMTLQQAGLVSINIRPDHQQFEVEGAVIRNTTTATFADGHQASVWDVDLRTFDILPPHEAWAV